jgi:predicted nucleotidyltransferase
LDPTIRLAEDIAERLGEVPGVAAVALGGCWARGEARPDSDVDLGLYYRPDDPPAVEDLRRLARELDDRRPRTSTSLKRLRKCAYKRVVSDLSRAGVLQ